MIQNVKIYVFRAYMAKKTTTTKTKTATL